MLATAPAPLRGQFFTAGHISFGRQRQPFRLITVAGDGDQRAEVARAGLIPDSYYAIETTGRDKLPAWADSHAIRDRPDGKCFEKGSGCPVPSPYRSVRTRGNNALAIFAEAKFMDRDDVPDVLREGYMTNDEYRWVCSNCAADFANRFKLTLIGGPAAT